MITRCSVAVVALTLALATSVPAAAADPDGAAAESVRLNQLFEDYFEDSLEQNPFLATIIGDPRYNDRLPNFLSKESLAASERFERRWLGQIRKLDRNLLSGQDRLSYDIFIYDRESALEGIRFPGELMPVDQMTSFPSQFAQVGSGQSIQPFRTTKDYRDWLSRIEGFVVLMDQMIENMREGMARGITQPKPLMAKVLPQLQAHMVDDPEKSVFFQPISNMPEGFSAKEKSELASAYRKIIRSGLVPAYRKLHDFIKNEYIPGCRDSIARSDITDGKAWYAYLVKTNTTTDMTPDEIHKFGLDEVARITAEMKVVMKEVGFKGDLPAFFVHLKTSDEFYYSSKEELLDGYRELQKTINAALPKAFDIFPKADYEVKEVPGFMAESSAGAFYQPGTPDGSRPGAFFVNTFNLKAQPRFGMETLSIHEAAPGHHFQISIAQEVEALPKFRRFGGQTAFAEGWALYAESLGRELGLFSDPYQFYGRLNDEMLRAMRLVVDTGMHDKAWSREKAIQYMLDHSSMAESDIIAEVERYIAIPGQALAYKVGQSVISRLRARAEKELGGSFDIKAFHRAILIDGSLPMGVLETKMGEWLAVQKKSAALR
jgi:uncharacterized protein (DUF885 family)